MPGEYSMQRGNENSRRFRASLRFPPNKHSGEYVDPKKNDIFKKHCGFSYDPKKERHWESWDEDYDEISTFINNYSNFSIGDDGHFPVPDGVEYDEEADLEKYFPKVL